MKQLIVKIYGHVQGVFFREEAQKFAKSLGLVGYVKNLPDGTVELIAEGPEDALKKLLEYCKIGPLLAKVRSIDESWESVAETQFEDFQIKF